MASRRGAEGSRRVAFWMAVLHSGAEDAEARSLRSALREWGSFGRSVVLLDGKGGAGNADGNALCAARCADVAGIATLVADCKSLNERAVDSD